MHHEWLGTRHVRRVLGRLSVMLLSDALGAKGRDDRHRSYEEVVLAVRRRVLAEVRRGVSFYIGITESPDRRWGEHCAAGGMRHWQMMLVLVQATTSSTTAAMEQLLLSEFGSRYQCHNVGPGGECASAGSPHFLYILLAQDGLLRRSY